MIKMCSLKIFSNVLSSVNKSSYVNIQRLPCRTIVSSIGMDSKGRTKRPVWKKLIAEHTPLLLPAAHDALTARILERVGFNAYQIGGFALNGARHAYPDLDLTHFGEERNGFYDIISASSLPVMIDADDCYGDVKNVTRTIRGYEALGASALFFEDQQAPKRCGHLKGKRLVSVEAMVSKIRAALAARSEPDFFIIARTDAIEAYGLDEALRRGERYLHAGADGLFIEGPRSIEQIERIGRHFKGASLCVNIFEGGGRTPWVSPEDLHKMGFSMILYPTTILFSVTYAIEQAAKNLNAGKQLSSKDSVDFKTYEDIVGLPQWEEIEKKFHHEEQ